MLYFSNHHIISKPHYEILWYFENHIICVIEGFCHYIIRIINFVPIRDTDEEVIHNIITVKRIDFIECIQDDEKVVKIWKPEKCQVG